MYTEEVLQEYLDEIREQVCSRCVEKPPGGPPCAPLGKMCGIEMHLPLYLKAIHQVESPLIDLSEVYSRYGQALKAVHQGGCPLIDPYFDSVHRGVCNQCVRKDRDGCPCPMDYLLVLLVRAIETVDRRRQLYSAYEETEQGACSHSFTAGPVS